MVNNNHSRLWRVIATSLTEWMDMALADLIENEAHLNQLNVFPVPDGDTGYNMVATFREAVLELRQHPWNSFEGAWKHLAEGALNGARGNSGMILSQLLRGFAEASEGQLGFEPRQLLDAFRHAAYRAREQVVNPVEGTILTVADAMGSVEVSGDVVDVLTQVVQSGEIALRETPSQLPLSIADTIVDAGALGYLTIVRGWLKAALGAEPSRELLVHQGMAELQTGDVMTDIPFFYDVEALLYRLRRTDAEEFLRHKLAHLGDSIVVAGTKSIVKVHVHTNQPVALVALLTEVGDVRQMEWLDMRYQVERRIEPGLKIAAPARLHPLFSETYQVTELNGGCEDVADTLVIGSDEHFKVALPVESLALAREIAHSYVLGESWESNRARFLEAMDRRQLLQVFWDGESYLCHGQNFSDREELTRFLEKTIIHKVSMRVYLSQNSSSEEARYWMQTLGVELVPTPHRSPWMEIVWPL